MRKLLIFFITIVAFFSCKKQDIIAPEIILNGENSISVQLYESYLEPGAQANDLIDGDLTSSIISTNNINTNSLGKYNVVYSVTDNSGNTGISKRYVDVVYKTDNSIIVNDTVKPVITITGLNPRFIKLNTPYIDEGSFAIDYIYGDLTPFIIVYNNVNSNMVGTYSVTYSVTDFSGNLASKIRTVNVINDNIAPVITLLGQNPLNIAKNNIYIEPGAHAYDNYFGDLSNHIIINGNVNTSSVGTYTINYSVKDPVGNVSHKTRIVNVINEPPPQVNDISNSNSENLNLVF